MKLFGATCIAFWLILTAGCYQRHKPVTFLTPFGEIEKGSAMTDVMDTLGNPHQILSQKNAEKWSYHLIEDKKITVHFINGKVEEIQGPPGFVTRQEEQ
ncbi:MAG: hypothetical protein JSW40_09670 [Candidatus Omnitrophota bacterium]|nr:MAG: hypothetical protein JSW40_09670 [Candidatus Omnitrophota bacterium]